MTNGQSGGGDAEFGDRGGTRERRVAPRVEVMAQIRVKRGRLNHILDVGNISTTGIFITLDSSDPISGIRVGMELEMDLFATDELYNLHLRGRIVRLVSDNIGICGFGAQFLDLDEQSRRALIQIVGRIDATDVQPPPLPGAPSDDEG